MTFLSWSHMPGGITLTGPQRLRLVKRVQDIRAGVVWL